MSSAVRGCRTIGWLLYGAAKGARSRPPCEFEPSGSPRRLDATLETLNESESEGTMTGSTRQFDITIAGELNLDLVLYGLPRDLPPEREILASNMALTLGASSAIAAHNLAALGNRVGFISRIGTDSLGQIALDR